MDVVILFNGLGNQMSQYAFYLNKKRISPSTRFLFSKKSRNNHNGYELKEVFGIEYKDTLINKILYFIFLLSVYKKSSFVSKLINRILHIFQIRTIEENEDYNFKPGYLLPSRGITFYVGGWHSEKYFVDIKDIIKNIFQFPINKIDPGNREILGKMNASTSVSVHIRRGDFLDSGNFSKFGAVCSLSYFQMAIEKMKSLVPRPHFFFFSNDSAWVKNNFAGPDFTLVDINRNSNSWKDMFLISNCRHHINSNGSFSWWSAWLNKNPEACIIVPKNFMVNRHFEDIYPTGWIQLSDY